MRGLFEGMNKPDGLFIPSSGASLISINRYIKSGQQARAFDYFWRAKVMREGALACAVLNIIKATKKGF